MERNPDSSFGDCCQSPDCHMSSVASWLVTCLIIWQDIWLSDKACLTVSHNIWLCDRVRLTMCHNIRRDLSQDYWLTIRLSEVLEESHWFHLSVTPVKVHIILQSHLTCILTANQADLYTASQLYWSLFVVWLHSFNKYLRSDRHHMWRALAGRWQSLSLAAHTGQTAAEEWAACCSSCSLSALPLIPAGSTTNTDGLSSNSNLSLYREESTTPPCERRIWWGCTGQSAQDPGPHHCPSTARPCCSD
mgnify:CR=1 FL=1